MTTVLRVIDIETTGMEPPAEVIEFGWQDVRRLAGGRWVLDDDSCGSKLFSPERPCPPEVMAVHHILPRDLKGEPRFTGQAIIGAMECLAPQALSQDVYVAHNAKFERAFLSDALTPADDPTSPQWGCTYKAALRVWPDAPSHGNQALMYFLGLHEEMDEERRHPPHRAFPDAYVTAHLLCRLLNEGGVTVEELVNWTTEPPLMPRCPIGNEWRGKKWAEVDAGFLRWMLGKPDMEADLKWNAQRELDRRAAR